MGHSGDRWAHIRQPEPLTGSIVGEEGCEQEADSRLGAMEVCY